MRLLLHAVAALLTTTTAKDQPQNLELKYEDPHDGPLRDMELDLTMVIDEEIKKLMTPEQLEDLENAAFQETIRQSRGDRESQGVRDQWESRDGIGRKEDLRRKMTKKTRRRLEDHGLDCKGCTNAEAIDVINDFVRREQKRIKSEEYYADRRRKIMGFLVPFGGLVVLLGIGFLVLQASAAAVDRPRKVDDEIREAIRQTQFYAEAMAAAKAESLSKPAPSWRDNEELEEWTPRQEKQFRKALGPLMGLPPKERWRLVAEKVEGKNHKECAAHYKLQQILEREAAEGKKDA